MRTYALEPVDRAAAAAARARIDALTKPPGSLGAVETLAVRLAGIAGRVPAHPYVSKAIVIGAGDHGVAAEGVSAYPSAVTLQMVATFLRGRAAIDAFARTAGADVFVANFGVAGTLAPHARLIDVPVGPGTANFAHGPAMPPEHVGAALDAGARVFADIRSRRPYAVIALGEMGIANTTSAAATIAALTGASPASLVGRGTGIDDAAYDRKREVVARAVAPLAGADWSTIAGAVGGYEIIGLAGVLLAAAAARLPVVLDGFIVAAAALLAERIAPGAADYCIAGHRSVEPGHTVALAALGLVPLLDLQLRLGEGSGAALALPLVEAATRMLLEMQTFAEAGVSGPA